MVLELCKAGNDELSLLLNLDGGGCYGRPVEDASCSLLAHFLPASRYEKAVPARDILGNRSQRHLAVGG